MLIRNLIMAIILALLYLAYLKGLTIFAKKISPEKQAFLVGTQVIKTIFFGLVLNVLLSLIGLMSFNFADIFISITLIILFQTL